jgi:hypothetical protein
VCLGGETRPRNTHAAPAQYFGWAAPFIGLWNKLFFMEVFEMPRRRRTSVQKNSHETRVVQFSRSPSILAARGRAVKVSPKLEQKAHPVVSSGTDPGPAGFDWEELKPTNDTH